MLLILILLLATWLRLNNLNWDSNFHLNPDERFLTMVGTGMADGFKFFVYGSFPLTINKFFAQIFGNGNYNAFTIQGRFLSALADLLVVVLVYKTLELLFSPKAKKMNLPGSRVALWGAFLYAVAVLPIQHAHFFVVDPFLNLFMFASFYFALRWANSDRVSQNVVVSAICLGLALASKITAVFILPLILYLILKSKKYGYLPLFLLISGVVAVVASPHYLNPSFLENLKTLASLEGADIGYPPAVQWINKTPIIFSLKNLAFWGVGIPYFILVVIGIVKILNSKFLPAGRHGQMLKVVFFWMIVFFVYQSTRFAQPMRYFLPLYPFLAIFAAIGTTYLLNLTPKFFSDVAKITARSTKNLTSAFTILILLIWPIMFSSIYLREHSRVVASEWIYKNLKNNSLILTEHWDDGLPLPISPPAGGYDKKFRSEQLPVFDQDTPEKWQRMDEMLSQGDYYILSSNRAWGSIQTASQKYPLMNKFYKDLFEGRFKYKKIKEFMSYPEFQISNFKFQIDDSSADESFTVYDHPKVMIFKRQP